MSHLVTNEESLLSDIELVRNNFVRSKEKSDTKAIMIVVKASDIMKEYSFACIVTCE